MSVYYLMELPYILLNTSLYLLLKIYYRAVIVIAATNYCLKIVSHNLRCYSKNLILYCLGLRL